MKRGALTACKGVRCKEPYLRYPECILVIGIVKQLRTYGIDISWTLITAMDVLARVRCAQVRKPYLREKHANRGQRAEYDAQPLPASVIQSSFCMANAFRQTLVVNLAQLSVFTYFVDRNICDSAHSYEVTAYGCYCYRVAASARTCSSYVGACVHLLEFHVLPCMSMSS
jgi:hypothetical protein